METTVISALVPLEYKQASLLENLIDRNIGGLRSEEIDGEYSLIHRSGGFTNKVNTKELNEINIISLDEDNSDLIKLIKTELQENMKLEKEKLINTNTEMLDFIKKYNSGNTDHIESLKIPLEDTSDIQRSVSPFKRF